MKRGYSLYEFRDDLAHSLKMLKRGEFSVCVWDAGELPCVWICKIKICFVKELSTWNFLLALAY